MEESVVPQLAQHRAIGVAHSSQNLALGEFSCWQRGQFITGYSTT
jgi:hypothetical protein